MSISSQLYKPYFRGGGGVVFFKSCENQHFFHILLTFWSDFYYFHGDFWHSKNVDVYSFLGVRGSQKVYGLYSHENVDIYGQPLTYSILNWLHMKANFVVNIARTTTKTTKVAICLCCFQIVTICWWQVYIFIETLD